MESLDVYKVTSFEIFTIYTYLYLSVYNTSIVENQTDIYT